MRMPILCAVLLASAACGEVVKTNIAIERCTNGLDDEGPVDDLIDCADPECGDVTTCVPTGAPETAGVVVDADDPCPAGFQGGEELIHRGLEPGTCEGCGCEVGATQCTARLWTYADDNECNGDVGLSGGTLLGITITEDCTADPIYYSAPAGIRADITGEGSCTASGSPIPAASGWSETVKFCRITQAGNGCAPAHACVPKAPTVAAQCTLTDGANACDAFATAETDWYTGVDDQRTCGACFCSAVGGDCDAMEVEVGNDYSCGAFGHNVGDDQKLCWNPAPYLPDVRLIGTPTPAAGCTAASTPSGAITPTGQQTLCCAPE